MKFDKKSLQVTLLLIILSVSVAYIAASGMKALFAVPRPCELIDTCPESFSFPSRHTAMAFAAATALSFYVRKLRLTVLIYVIAAAIGYWRLSMGVHTMVDIVGGALVGVVIGLGMYYFVKKFKGTIHRRAR